MTTKEYYRILEERWNSVNKNNLQAIREYNEWKRQLRKELQDGKNDK